VYAPQAPLMRARHARDALISLPGHPVGAYLDDKWRIFRQMIRYSGRDQCPIGEQNRQNSPGLDMVVYVQKVLPQQGLSTGKHQAKDPRFRSLIDNVADGLETELGRILPAVAVHTAKVAALGNLNAAGQRGRHSSQALI